MAAQSPVAFKGSVILMEHARKMQAQRDRAARRELAQQQRSFAGAQINRLTASWQATSDKIDDELRNDLDALRNRSRSLENNNDYARKYLDMVETNIIGDAAPRLVSLVDNAPGNPDTLARQAISKSYAEWCKRGNCEISGQYSFTSICQNIARGGARDGEFLIREITGPDAGNAWNYALQVLDVDRLATWKNRNAAQGQNAIVTGVEVNKYGKPVAYWFNVGPLSANSRQAERVEASEVLHRFKITRPEQKRGIPWMHASMVSMHYAGEFALSALMAAKQGADHLGYFVSPNGEPPALGDEAEDEDGARIVTSAPGTWDTLPAGWDVKTVDSKYPNEVFGPFLKAANQRMASGLPGASYPELCNDYEAVNFSSIRAAIITARDEWRKQHALFAADWLEPIFANWLRWSLLSGAIKMPNGTPLPIAKAEKFSAHGWMFRGWSWVDPLKDLQAAREALDLKVTSRSRIAGEMGRDLEDVFDELQKEEALADTYSIDLAPAPKAPADNAEDGNNGI